MRRKFKKQAREAGGTGQDWKKYRDDAIAKELEKLEDANLDPKGKRKKERANRGKNGEEPEKKERAKDKKTKGKKTEEKKKRDEKKQERCDDCCLLFILSFL